MKLREIGISTVIVAVVAVIIFEFVPYGTIEKQFGAEWLFLLMVLPLVVLGGTLAALIGFRVTTIAIGAGVVWVSWLIIASILEGPGQSDSPVLLIVVSLVWIGTVSGASLIELGRKFRRGPDADSKDD